MSETHHNEFTTLLSKERGSGSESESAVELTERQKEVKGALEVLLDSIGVGLVDRSRLFGYMFSPKAREELSGTPDLDADIQKARKVLEGRGSGT